MKITEQREEYSKLSGEELQSKLSELKQELFNLRFQHTVNQLENTSRLKEIRKEIARVLTYINQQGRE